MTKAGAIVGKAMAALVADAIARNLSVDFIRLLPTGHDACRSRFIEAPGMALAVEVPSRMGHPVPVRPGLMNAPLRVACFLIDGRSVAS